MAALKAIIQERRKINYELKKHLLREHKSKKRNSDREKKIEILTKKLQELEKKKKNTEREESKLSYLIENEYLKLSTENKLFMDYIKIIARNMFYISLQPFKEEYNNYRDDHVLFRNLIRSRGFLYRDGNKVTISLYPTAKCPPKVRLIVDNILEEKNKCSQRLISRQDIIFSLKLETKHGIFPLNEPSWGN